MMAPVGNSGQAINPNQLQVMAVMPQSNSQPMHNNGNNFLPPRRMVTCYQCDEVGHISTNCPNPKKPTDYVPMCGTCKEQGHVSEDYPGRMMPPIRDLGSNVASSLKQVNLIEMEMIDSIFPYTMVGVVTRSKGLHNGLIVQHSNTESSSNTSDSSNGSEPTMVLIATMQVPSKKDPKKVTFQDVHPNALKKANKFLKAVVLHEVEGLQKDIGKSKSPRQRNKIYWVIFAM